MNFIFQINLYFVFGFQVNSLFFLGLFVVTTRVLYDYMYLFPFSKSKIEDHNFTEEVIRQNFEVK